MSVEIVAEIAQAHEGSLGILHSYIDTLASIGVDTIKFQMHIAEAESSSFEPFRVAFSYEDKTRYDYWQRMGFTFEQWVGIKKHCDEKGVRFLCSPFSNCAVNVLERLGVDRYKIGAGEVTNFLMLDKIAKTGKDIIISSGMSNYRELDDTVTFLKKHKNNLTILQCTTKYPTGAQDIGLNVIAELKERYSVPVGFSDHSGKIYSSLGAIALGAEIIECHVVFHKKIFGPDTESSLNMEQLEEVVEGARFLSTAIENKIDKHKNDQFKDLKCIFEKSLAINKDKKKGEIISLDDLEAKKPFGYGISASDYEDVLGRKVAKDLKKWDFIDKDTFDV